MFGYVKNVLEATGNSLFFLKDVLFNILRGRVRWSEVLKQIYEQGLESVVIIVMASFASGVVLAL